MNKSETIQTMMAKYDQTQSVLSFLAVSYNRPKFSSNACWNPYAVTLGNAGASFSSPYTVFVNSNNTIFVSNPGSNNIQVWQDYNTTATRIISVMGNNSYGMFVAANDDIYVNNGAGNRVDKWFGNGTSNLPAMLIYGDCFGLFIDTNNTLYCSVGAFHLVGSILIGDMTNTLQLVAGTGCAGSIPECLSSPRGIFVDINYNLYVADRDNNRIQKFQSGQRNGSTVAGCGVSGTMYLNSPTGVVLDQDGYVFIVDSSNNRIVGSGSSGFRCIVGCSGSASDQLSGPRTMAFDSFGNIWVADYGNNRVQKFFLENSSCGEYNHLF